MALNKVLIALTCAVVLPVAALAQSPAWSLATRADCCATDDGGALAAAVLLPPALTLPTDERTDALAASVLLPGGPEGCCGAAAPVPAALDHSAHLGVPAAKKAGHAMADMPCCAHEAAPATAKADGGCCKEMKDGCGMPCCQSMPPTR